MKILFFIAVFAFLFSHAARAGQVRPCFHAVGKEPIIKNGDFFAGSNWNDPHVLKIGKQFVMYASADENFSQNIKIYRLVSKDGYSWDLSPQQAVFERPKSSSEWDGKSVETPAVIFFKGQYYMFYTGYTDQEDIFSYSIGYATSPDGIAWTRKGLLLKPQDPKALFPNLNFMQYVVGEPAPVVVGNKIYLYFAASGAHSSVNADVFTIGLTMSEHGVSWAEPRMVLFPDPKIFPRKKWKGYSTPNAVIMSGKVHLFFDVAENPFTQIRIHHAVSADGISNWVQDKESILENSEFAWADHEINGPSVILDGNKLMLWFGGHGGIANFPKVSMGIGMAVCDLEPRKP